MDVSATDTRTWREVEAATALTIVELDAALNDPAKDVILRAALEHPRFHPQGRARLAAGASIKSAPAFPGKRQTLESLALRGRLQVVDV